TLVGWYTDDGALWDFEEDTVTEDLTLTAKWGWTVTFMDDDEEINSLPIINGEKIEPQDDPEPVPYGYKFDGWYIYDADKVEDEWIKWEFDTDVVEDDIKLIARWVELPKYIVTFDPDNGEDDTFDVIDVIEGKTVAVPEVFAELEHPTYSTLVGWYTNDDALWDFDEDVVIANMKLTAKWGWTVTIEYVGEVGGEPDPIAVIDEETLEDSYGYPPYQYGYKFDGCYTDEDLSEEWDIDEPIKEDKTLYAKWNKAIFVVNFESNGGSAVDYVEVDYLDPIDEPSPPTRSGYTFKGWYIDADLSEEWDFDTPIEEDITLYAKWEAVQSTDRGSGAIGTSSGEEEEEIVDIVEPGGAMFPFIDVTEGQWFYGSVYYMWENGLMNGISEVLFDPNGALTRGMVVTVLYRMEDSPDVTGFENPFGDVAEDKWYANAITWAAEYGIVLGFTETRFGPDEYITREQLAAILYRYQDYTGKIPPDVLGTREFADGDKISEYARTAVDKIVMQGIMEGRPNNIFDPVGNATRSEFAAVIQRYLDSLSGVLPEVEEETEEELEEEEDLEEELEEIEEEAEEAEEEVA
ncbi:MAG: InlB B-repeat-containing protein, partial [Oscillospiraceae bacterium]|nr:InlB B-repeat-containing protein [Oscillospiraceae bacterium]